MRTLIRRLIVWVLSEPPAGTGVANSSMTLPSGNRLQPAMPPQYRTGASASSGMVNPFVMGLEGARCEGESNPALMGEPDRAAA